MLRFSLRRLISSSPVSGIGHEVTLNGFGVMMSSPEKDPFVHQWINDTITKLKTENCPANKKATIVSSLEVGCAFGAASLELMRQACAITSNTSGVNNNNNNSSSTSILLHTANDIEGKHLKKMMSRYENFNIEQRKAIHNNSSEKDHHHHKFQNPHQLRSWPGRVPDIFEQQNKLIMEESNAESASEFTNRFDTICIANVLHFLTPQEIHQTLSHLYKNHARPGSKIYISLDSPFTKAYRSLYPIYKIKEVLFKSKSPGFTGKRFLKRKFIQKRIPDRLKGMENYHVMVPETLERFVKEAGWEIDDECAKLFAGDATGNPQGVSLNGKEMVGVVGVKK